MMLMSKATNKILVRDLKVASGFWERTKGLLGRKDLPQHEGLFIKRCNSIHTFFMNFKIDVVFVDSSLIVQKTLKAVPPGRLILPVFRASHVIELSAGFLENNPIQLGEQLHVDHSLS